MNKQTILSLFGVALVLLLCTGAHAQTWVKVASENQAVTLSAPATVRFGSMLAAPDLPPCPTAGCWTQLTPAALTFAVSNTFFSGDPDLNVVKELDVLETSTPQVVMVDGSPVNVPALPAAVPATIPTPPGQAYAVTLAISQTDVAPEDVGWVALGLGLYDFPKAGGAAGFIGSIVNLTIDGVTFRCTYGSQAGGVFTMSCAVPAAAK